MIKRLLFLSLFSVMVILGLQFAAVRPVSASSDFATSRVYLPPTFTQITLSPPGDLFASTPFTIQGILEGYIGQGIPSKDIDFSLDGNFLGATATKPDGSFQLVVDKPLTVGTYLLIASFKGGRQYDPSQVSLFLLILPANDLVLAAPDTVNLNESFQLTGALRNRTTGEAITNATINFSTNGTYQSQTRTNDHGLFKLQFNNNLDAGTYLVSASYKGAHHSAPAQSFFLLKVLPATVQVQTVPAIAGITFQMNSQKFVSGQDGMASIQINKAGIYRLDVLIDQYQNPSQHIEFGRWAEESYTPFKDVQVPTDSPIQVGLNVFHQVSQKYVDLDGVPVGPSRITSVTIRSAQGDVFNILPGQAYWLPASRTDRRATGLEETDLLYSVISVTIDGSNVVNSAQQRFFANSDDTWTISLLLYSLDLDARDGLFGSPVGKSVNLSFPDGQVKNYPLDASGKAVIHSMARGIYHLDLIGSSGMGTSMPVALSRNQVVNINVVTRTDFVIVAVIGLGVALALILFGRPWLLQYLRKGRRSLGKKTGWTSINEN